MLRYFVILKCGVVKVDTVCCATGWQWEPQWGAVV